LQYLDRRAFAAALFILKGLFAGLSDEEKANELKACRKQRPSPGHAIVES
jgi:hypothetical protein